MYVFLSQVRVSLYKDGSEILSMVFDASNSDSENWFSKDRITYVPWTDLRSEKTNVFDVKVCCGRAFSIFRNYGGCGNDAGWLVITGMDCGWENRFPKTTVMYSKLGTYVDLNDFGRKNGHNIVIFFPFLFTVFFLVLAATKGLIKGLQFYMLSLSSKESCPIMIFRSIPGRTI